MKAIISNYRRECRTGVVLRGRSPCWDSGSRRVCLERSLDFKGRSSHVRMEFTRNYEATNLCRDHLRGEIGRTSAPPTVGISRCRVCLCVSAAPLLLLHHFLCPQPCTSLLFSRTPVRPRTVGSVGGILLLPTRAPRKIIEAATLGTWAGGATSGLGWTFACWYMPPAYHPLEGGKRMM